MVSRSLTDLDPKLRPLAQQFLDTCHQQSIPVFLTCTYRSDTEQNALYAQGRTTPGRIVTYAKAQQSPHNCTLDNKGITPASRAFDIAIMGSNKVLDWNVNSFLWQQSFKIGRTLGLQLGADWPPPKTDGPHFELLGWRNA